MSSSQPPVVDKESSPEDPVVVNKVPAGARNASELEELMMQDLSIKETKSSPPKSKEATHEAAPATLSYAAALTTTPNKKNAQQSANGNNKQNKKNIKRNENTSSNNKKDSLSSNKVNAKGGEAKKAAKTPTQQKANNSNGVDALTKAQLQQVSINNDFKTLKL